MLGVVYQPTYFLNRAYAKSLAASVFNLYCIAGKFEFMGFSVPLNEISSQVYLVHFEVPLSSQLPYVLRYQLN